MTALLDTHALLWWLSDDRSLTRAARTVISAPQNSIVVSVVSALELAIKVRIGKLPSATHLVADLVSYLDQEGFEVLNITADHAIRAGLLPGPHRDPFDRLLIAQAQSENIALVSKDAAFDAYGVRRIW